MTKDIKLIVCDCDGTILDDNKKIDSGLKGIIPKLKKKGITFTLASGRNYYLMKPLVSELEIDQPYISDNGGNIYQFDKRLINNSIPLTDTNVITNYLFTLKIPFMVYTDKGVYTYLSTEHLAVFKRKLIDLMPIYEYDPSYNFDHEGCFKITIDSTDIDNFVDVVDKVNSDCPQVNFAQSEGKLYTITAVNATKGNAIKELAKLLNIDPQEVMVFGDNHNDVTMFEVAGVSVAPSNSEEDTKKVASSICGSNNECGVSCFLSEYFEL